uniref:Uncharacterized protein n=1 Tax=Cacopsylla melanoneura TaxID=428564 RepID=A0A8D8WB37_9HEMI
MINSLPQIDHFHLVRLRAVGTLRALITVITLFMFLRRSLAPLRVYHSSWHYLQYLHFFFLGYSTTHVQCYYTYTTLSCVYSYIYLLPTALLLICILILLSGGIVCSFYSGYAVCSVCSLCHH